MCELDISNNPEKHSSSVRKANKSESNSNYQDNIQNNPSSSKTVDVNFLPENELEKENYSTNIVIDSIEKRVL